ncbi:MAG: cytochrome B5 [Chloroflexi bacterium]|nr:cytochrome B5 [Chloroflexota bacterium]
MTLRTLTLSELAQYNGKNGAPAFVAYKGRVYDVSSSYHWRGGRHWASHQAGTDLTLEMADAPHSAEMLERFPAVGVLIEEEVSPTAWLTGGID